MSLWFVTVMPAAGARFLPDSWTQMDGIDCEILSTDAWRWYTSLRPSPFFSVPCLGKVRADPTLEANQRTYTSAINCFQQFQGRQSVASLASTLAGQSSREEMLLNPIPSSDVYLGGSPDTPEGGEVG